MKYRSRSLACWLVLIVTCGCSGGDDSLNTNSGGVVGGGGGGGTSVGAGGGGGLIGGGGGIPQVGSGLFSFDTGIGGSGGVIGAIVGFGSVIVNDLEMNTDDAAIYFEGELGQESDLREGQFVVVTGDLDALEAREIYYRSNLKGPISAPPALIDPLAGRAELSVLGQTVLIGPETRLYGVTLMGLVEGLQVEVSGAVGSDGQVVASFIEQKSTLLEYKAVGVVSALDPAATRFDLGGLRVSYGGASYEAFQGKALANGQLVEVRMDPGQFAAPASGTAHGIELLPMPQLGEGAELEVEGAIDEFTSASSFSVSGISISTNSATEFERGAAGDLALNVRVEVEGRADATGTLVAAGVKFKRVRNVRFEGRIMDVMLISNSSGSIVTEVGLSFEIRDSTELEDKAENSGEGDFALADLTVGDYILARGFPSGGGVLAVELERDDLRDRVLLRGPLDGFSQGSGPSGSVIIQGVTVLEQDGITDYRDADRQISRDEFYGLLGASESVSARWDEFSGATDIVDRLTLEEEGDD